MNYISQHISSSCLVLPPLPPQDVFNDTRSILEPAGAVSLAGCKAYLNRHNIRGKKVVAVTSGANMNFERLRLVSELAEVGARKEAMLFTAIPEVRVGGNGTL